MRTYEPHTDLHGPPDDGRSLERRQKPLEERENENAAFYDKHAFLRETRVAGDPEILYERTCRTKVEGRWQTVREIS